MSYKTLFLKYYTIHSRRISFFAFVFVCLFMSDGAFGAESKPQLHFPPGARQSTVWNTVDLVIVTTLDLLPEFTRLADWRSEHGTSATVVTIDWIEDVTPPGVDLPETIRNFLTLAYDQWQTRNVLFGGDWDLLPPRYVRSYLVRSPEHDYTDLVSDWYFGCLDGTWDEDGDGIYGEFYVTQDNPDLVPELAVGRAPVRSQVEASVFVDKVLAHEQSGGEPHLNRGLFLAEVLLPFDWQPGDLITWDGAQNIEDMMPIFNGANPPVMASRLYENFTSYAGADSLSHLATIDSLTSGNFNIVYHMGQGNEVALCLGGYPVSDLLEVSDVPDLTNSPNYFTIMSLTGLTAKHGGSPTIFPEMIRSAVGGAVAAFGKTEFTIISSSVATDEVLLQELLSIENTMLGQAHRQVLLEMASLAATNPQYHLTLMEMALLGDPTMHFRPPVISAVDEVEWNPTANVSVFECYPNPFNPQTTIAFELPRRESVTLQVFDMAGRLVKSLITAEPHTPGRHEVVWNGRDDTDRQVASGTYFYRLEAGSFTETKRMVLVK